MKKVIVILALILFNLALISAQAISSSKAQKVDELMNILGSEEQYQAFINVGLDNLIRKYGSKLSKTDIDILKQESVALIRKFIVEDLKNIYDKYLTEAEINDLIVFYSSETGRRFRQVQPMITTEINQVMVSKYMEEFKEILAARLTSNQAEK